MGGWRPSGRGPVCCHVVVSVRSCWEQTRAEATALTGRYCTVMQVLSHSQAVTTLRVLISGQLSEGYGDLTYPLHPIARNIGFRQPRSNAAFGAASSRPARVAMVGMSTDRVTSIPCRPAYDPGVSPSTRDALVDAAAVLLDDGGPGAVTLREVGRRAGVSHNAPYKHFDDKEALLAAVAARELAFLAANLAEPATWSAPMDALREAVRCYVSWALDRPARFKLVFGGWSDGPAELAVAAEQVKRVLTDIVAAAQQAGVLPVGDPERMTALICSVAHGSVDLALAGHIRRDGGGGADPVDLVEDFLGHLRDAARTTG